MGANAEMVCDTAAGIPGTAAPSTELGVDAGAGAGAAGAPAGAEAACGAGEGISGADATGTEPGAANGCSASALFMRFCAKKGDSAIFDDGDKSAASGERGGSPTDGETRDIASLKRSTLSFETFSGRESGSHPSMDAYCNSTAGNASRWNVTISSVTILPF